ncbi:MinD/ParA family protein [Mycobacterium sp. E3247]|uniref:MinD/ParA family ATP-binding protein n=1 Tax=Mycobacterium sp. E3247 TaxID=1856864 RepID=UPI0035126D8E
MIHPDKFVRDGNGRSAGDQTPPWPAPQTGRASTPFTSTASANPPELPRARMPSNAELGLSRTRPVPRAGWRKKLHQVTGINPGESAEQARQRATLDRVNQPVRGAFSIAVLSQKGGVGKTTTAIGLGATLATVRGDRVIAVDANPDFGTLSQRGPNETRSTVRDVLLDENIVRYSDIRRHTSQGSSRLELLASERDPVTSEAFSDNDYRGVLSVLRRFYNIILTDCGTGLVHSAMSAVLDEADVIVVVASPAIDSARSALATLDWLEQNGYGHLAAQTTVVLSASRPGPTGLDVDLLASHFVPRVRALHIIPFDDHLAEGSEINFDLLSRQTRHAFLELAATIADGFSTLSARSRNRGALRRD